MLACVGVQAEDGPKITIDATASFRDHLLEIQRQSREKFSSESPDGAVTLRVKNAGFYEALDALCRAHGNMSYLNDVLSDEPLQIESKPWIEYPCVYSGPYKIVVVGLARFKMRSEEAEAAWTRVHIALLVPPSASTRRFRPDAKWSCREAIDASGASVLPLSDEEPRESAVVAEKPTLAGAACHGILLKDFDTAKGLGRLSGKVEVEIDKLTELRIAAEPGSIVETPQGSVTVKSVAEFEKSDAGSTWRIALEYTPKDRTKSESPFAPEMKIDGEWADTFGVVVEPGKPFEVKTWREVPRPKVVTLRLRTGTRTVAVPYEFKNLAWKDK
jgi:hypothetical protein